MCVLFSYILSPVCFEFEFVLLSICQNPDCIHTCDWVAFAIMHCIHTCDSVACACTVFIHVIALHVIQLLVWCSCLCFFKFFNYYILTAFASCLSLALYSLGWPFATCNPALGLSCKPWMPTPSKQPWHLPTFGHGKPFQTSRSCSRCCHFVASSFASPTSSSFLMQFLSWHCWSWIKIRRKQQCLAIAFDFIFPKNIFQKKSDLFLIHLKTCTMFDCPPTGLYEQSFGLIPLGSWSSSSFHSWSKEPNKFTRFDVPPTGLYEESFGLMPLGS